MKIKLNVPLTDLSGKVIKDEEQKDFTLGQALANIMSSSEVGGKMKLFTLAIDMYKKESLDVDAADLALIKETVKNTKIYKPLIAGQVEFLLEDVKDEK